MAVEQLEKYNDELKKQLLSARLAIEEKEKEIETLKLMKQSDLVSLTEIDRLSVVRVLKHLELQYEITRNEYEKTIISSKTISSIPSYLEANKLTNSLIDYEKEIEVLASKNYLKDLIVSRTGFALPSGSKCKKCGNDLEITDTEDGGESFRTCTNKECENFNNTYVKYHP